jgi:peptide/nickel transport system permease protein
MGKYILKRLLQIFITLIIFQTLLFLILDAQPGDISLQYVNNPDVPPEVREMVRARLGLDRPPLVRYFQWLRNFFTGELGVSYQHYPREVMDIILERAPRTIVLFLTASLVSFFTGFTLGKILAWKRGGFIEYSSTITGIILYTVFTPWFGLIMIWLFGFKLKLLPVGKFLDPVIWRLAPEGINANYVFGRLILTATVYVIFMVALWVSTVKLSFAARRLVRTVGFILITAGAIGVWALVGARQATGLAEGMPTIAVLALDIARHMILPIFVYTLVSFAGTMLLTRSTMLETLREDYVMAARAKGLTERVVRDKHAARNAFLPVFTSLVMSLPFTLSGGIITETVFSWPGMGLTLLQAAQSEDIPMAMGALSFIGLIALLAHLIADIMYSVLDPRIRYA